MLLPRIVAVGGRAMQCYRPGTAKVNKFDNLVPYPHTVSLVHMHAGKAHNYNGTITRLCSIYI